MRRPARRSRVTRSHHKHAPKTTIPTSLPGEASSSMRPATRLAICAIHACTPGSDNSSAHSVSVQPCVSWPSGSKIRAKARRADRADSRLQLEVGLRRVSTRAELVQRRHLQVGDRFFALHLGERSGGRPRPLRARHRRSRRRTIRHGPGESSRRACEKDGPGGRTERDSPVIRAGGA
jgi:hypothetical protein